MVLVKRGIMAKKIKETQKTKKVVIRGREFRWGLVAGLVAVLVLAGLFGAGYALGQWRLKKSQFCFPPQQLPRPLRRILEEGLGPEFWRRWQGRALIGRVERLSLTQLVIVTKAGQRRLELTPQTRYLQGRRPVKRVEINPGELVAVLLDSTKKIARAVIVLR